MCIIGCYCSAASVASGPTQCCCKAVDRSIATGAGHLVADGRLAIQERRDAREAAETGFRERLLCCKKYKLTLCNPVEMSVCGFCVNNA